MALQPRYALARSYALPANLTATVTDAGGAGRSVTIASSGNFIRPFLVAAAGSGTTAESPYDLFARASSQLTAGAGGGTWTVAIRTDGRSQVTWVGAGTGNITAGNLLGALGFTGATGALSTGQSAISAYPALGLIVWAISQPDGDWLPEQSGAITTDETGRSYRVRGAQVRYRRRLTAYWVPRTFTDNASGEYLSPLYESLGAGASGAAVTDPTPASPATAAWSWREAIFGTDGMVVWGFSDDFQSLTAGSYVSVVYLGEATYEGDTIAHPSEASSIATRWTLAVELVRTNTEEL